MAIPVLAHLSPSQTDWACYSNKFICSIRRDNAIKFILILGKYLHQHHVPSLARRLAHYAHTNFKLRTTRRGDLHCNAVEKRFERSRSNSAQNSIRSNVRDTPSVHFPFHKTNIGLVARRCRCRHADEFYTLSKWIR